MWACGVEAWKDEDEDASPSQPDTRFVLIDDLKVSTPSFVDAVNMALRVVDSGKAGSVLCGKIDIDEEKVRRGSKQ